MASSRVSRWLMAQFFAVLAILALQNQAVEAQMNGYQQPVKYCLDSATSFCDFLFSDETQQHISLGYAPNFAIKAKNDTAYGNPIIHMSNKLVSAANTDGRCDALPFGRTEPSINCHNNFYFIRNRLATRTFQKQDNKKDFDDRCIRFYITHIQLEDGTNLWPGDNNLEFPESRRCILFSTNLARTMYVS